MYVDNFSADGKIEEEVGSLPDETTGDVDIDMSFNGKDFLNKNTEPKDELDWTIKDEEVLEVLPDSGYVREYVLHGQRSCDAPLSYHLAAALNTACSAIGKADLVALSKNCKDSKIPLRLWCLVIGTSGDRKSTALSLGQQVLTSALPNRMMPMDATVEKWQEILAHDSDHVKLIFWEEFASLLEGAIRPYSKTSKTWLMVTYSGLSHERSTIGRGSIRIERPRLSILAATPKDTLSDQLTKDDWQSGFMARFNIFGGARTRYERHPTMGSEVPKCLQNHLLKSIGAIKRVEIPFDICDTVDDWAEQNIEGERHEIAEDLVPSYNRMHETVQIYAAILESSIERRRIPERISVGKESTELAIKLIKAQQRSIKSIYKLYILNKGGKDGSKVDNSYVKDLLKHVQNSGFSTLSDLKSGNFGSRPTLHAAISLLEMADDVFSYRYKIGVGRPARVIVDTTLLNMPQVTAFVKLNKIDIHKTLTIKQAQMFAEFLTNLKNGEII